MKTVVRYLFTPAANAAFQGPQFNVWPSRGMETIPLKGDLVRFRPEGEGASLIVKTRLFMLKSDLDLEIQLLLDVQPDA